VRKPQPPPSFERLMGSLPKPESLIAIFQAVSSPTNDGRYHHWGDLRHRKQRDALNKKFMADPRMKAMCVATTGVFDYKRQADGG